MLIEQRHDITASGDILRPNEIKAFVSATKADCDVAAAEKWDAPIYAHPLEVPYLNSTASYPPPDPTVGGGIMPLVAQFFPRGPVDVSRWLQVLPEDSSVPGMPGWRWLHTPGHADGHVSLWRETDRAIIAGDAFITTRMESAYSVAVQKPEMHGPPNVFHDRF